MDKPHSTSKSLKASFIMPDADISIRAKELDATIITVDMPSGEAGLPISSSSSKSLTVKWGDGTESTGTRGFIHNYTNPGIYQVVISGPHSYLWTLGNSTAPDTSFRTNLVSVDRLSSTITTFNHLFNCSTYGTHGCSKLDKKHFMDGLIGYDTSKISNSLSVYGMFYHTFDGWENPPSLPEEIGNWNFSNLTSTSRMFYGLYDSSVNPPALPESICNWKFDKNKDISSMFQDMYAHSVNPPTLPDCLGEWNLNSVKNFGALFSGLYRCAENPAALPNSIGNWDLSSATSIDSMFSGLYSVSDNSEHPECPRVTNNPPALPSSIGNWNLSNVSSAGSLFQQLYDGSNNPLALPDSIGNWNLSNLEDAHMMFSSTYSRVTNTPALPESIGEWNLSNLKNAERMFSNIYIWVKNPPILPISLYKWDVANASNMSSMFGNVYSGTSYIPTIPQSMNLSCWDVASISVKPYSGVSGSFDNGFTEAMWPNVQRPQWGKVWQPGEREECLKNLDNTLHSELSE